MSAGRSPSRGGEQPLHVVPGRPERQGFVGEDPRGHDRGRQARTAPAAPFGEPEERPEGRRLGLDGDARIALVPNLLGQQFIHLGDGQASRAAGRLRRSARGTRGSSGVGTSTVRGDRPALPKHVVGELGDVIGVRLLDRGRRLQPPQECQPSNGMAREPEPSNGEPFRIARRPGSTIGPAVRFGLDLGSRDEFAGPVGQTQGLRRRRGCSWRCAAKFAEPSAARRNERGNGDVPRPVGRSAGAPAQCGRLKSCSNIVEPPRRVRSGRRFDYRRGSYVAFNLLGVRESPTEIAPATT